MYIVFLYESSDKIITIENILIAILFYLVGSAVIGFILWWVWDEYRVNYQLKKQKEEHENKMIEIKERKEREKEYEAYQTYIENYNEEIFSHLSGIKG